MPDETFDMRFAKDNAAEEGFNRWMINGAAFPMTQGVVPASFYLRPPPITTNKKRNRQTIREYCLIFVRTVSLEPSFVP